LWWLRHGDGVHGDTAGHAQVVLDSLTGAFLTDTYGMKLRVIRNG
jgi:hypothetical protein